MKVLIIGLGSIAKKHIKALLETDPLCRIYALRSSPDATPEPNVINIAELSECNDPDFIIISNPTALHADAIKSVLKLKRPLFIEKPPFHIIEDAEIILPLLPKDIITYTAFNLRFLECLQYLKEKIKIEDVQEVNVYCGSYLPEWRSTDYKKSYSAQDSMGGGVHLDLIHELDYITWIFGAPQDIRKTLRSQSAIDVNSVDYANYVLTYPGFAVNIVLNYYRRDPKRSCEILLKDTTLLADLMKNSITDLLGSKEIFSSKQTVQDTYLQQMKYFINCTKKNTSPFNSLKESVETLKLAKS
jgi:predicted dehydrogenase